MLQEKIGLCFNIPNGYNQELFKLIEDLLDIPSYWVRGSHEEIYVLDQSGSTMSNVIFPEDEIILENSVVKGV